MPSEGQRQSRERREKAAAKADARAPTESGDARSTLAEFLRDPTPHKERALAKAAANGQLTTHDVQAGVAQLLAMSRKMLPGRGRTSPKVVAERAAKIETERPVHVLMKQHLDALGSIVQAAPSNGALVVVELHWPEAYAGVDLGDQVITTPPEGFT